MGNAICHERVQNDKFQTLTKETRLEFEVVVMSAGGDIAMANNVAVLAGCVAHFLREEAKNDKEFDSLPEKEKSSATAFHCDKYSYCHKSEEICYVTHFV